MEITDEMRERVIDLCDRQIELCKSLERLYEDMIEAADARDGSVVDALLVEIQGAVR